MLNNELITSLLSVVTAIAVFVRWMLSRGTTRDRIAKNLELLSSMRQMGGLHLAQVELREMISEDVKVLHEKSKATDWPEGWTGAAWSGFAALAGEIALLALAKHLNDPIANFINGAVEVLVLTAVVIMAASGFVIIFTTIKPPVGTPGTTGPFPLLRWRVVRGLLKVTLPVALVAVFGALLVGMIYLYYGKWVLSPLVSLDEAVSWIS